MSRRIVLVDIGAGLQLLGFLPAASAGEAYSARLTGRGGSAPYTYTLLAGALPAGLYLDRDTGTLAGTTTAPGDYAISVQLTDLAGSTLVRNFVLQVTGAVVSPLQLTGDAPAGRVGVVYSYPYSATGGKTPRTFSVASGALPPGLALSAGGLLAGTPTAAGNYAWTVRVIDSYGTTADLVDGATIAYATLALGGNYPAGRVGTAYSADLTISGGNGVYSNPRVTSGSLPAGLALSIVDNKLRLSGTPTSSDAAAFVAAIDSADGQSAATAQQIDFQSWAAWDPLTANADASISGRLLGSTNLGDPAARYGNARSSAAITGKRYFEIDASSGAATFFACPGVGDGSISLVNTYYVGADLSVGDQVGGNNPGLWASRTRIYAITETYPMTATICIAVDASTRKVWIRRGSSAWWGGGNPTDGTSPTYTLGGSAPLYAMASILRTGASALSRFAPSEQLYEAPDGYARGLPL